VRGPLLSDLDGTIADTAPAIFESLRVTCKAFDVALARDADLSWCLGPPLHWCLEQLGITEDGMADAIAVFETAHTQAIGLVVPMPGADVVIPELVEAGVHVGVATIKPQHIAELVLETIGLRERVRALHGRADDMDPRTKTDLLRDAAASLDGARPLYVGDHDNDEQAALDLGVPFLRYPDHSWDDIRSTIYG
jgi:phosphoglycolate phosphatase